MVTSLYETPLFFEVTPCFRAKIVSKFEKRVI